MSKRIMNEVMTLAEDEGLNIWYQDTDSMHINYEEVELLALAFKKIQQRFDRRGYVTISHRL